MTPTEFIPIPSSYSMENKYNYMSLINIEDVLTGKTLKKTHNISTMHYLCINKISNPDIHSYSLQLNFKSLVISNSGLFRRINSNLKDKSKLEQLSCKYTVI